jgi:glyoxylase I family protein
MANNVSVTGVHHIAIKVKDFDASLKFYTQTLGFPAQLTWGEGDKRAAMIDVGNGNCVELFAGGPAGPRPDGHWLHLALRCTDTKSAMEKVRKAGYEVTMDTKDITIESRPHPFPIRIGFFKGPDGELIEFFETR